MYEYWKGRGVDYRKLWRDFQDGRGYIAKFHSMRVHVLRLTFDRPPVKDPLFNHEAVYKTIKGYFHDLKQACLDPSDFDQAGPLFLYQIDRGSGIWSFLGELRQLLMLGTSLSDEKTLGQTIENMDRKLDFLRKHFRGAVNPEDFRRFMQAQTSQELNEALQQLLDQGLRGVEISEVPFEGDIEETSRKMIDLRRLLGRPELENEEGQDWSADQCARRTACGVTALAGQGPRHLACS